MRRLSLKGRNLVLQSMFYGSFRFWLYAMTIPDEVNHYIEQDAKTILWSTSPSIITTELGSKRARPYIHRKAAYRPEQSGGAGIIHWPSHAKAFYAEWIVRMLHPRRAPWKTVLRAWYPDWNHIEDGIFVAPRGLLKDLLDHIPRHASYIRRCITEFISIRMEQNLDFQDNRQLAEPVWHNHRFHIQLPESRVDVWVDEQQVYHVANLIDPHTDSFHDDANWSGFFRDFSPHQSRRIMRGDLNTILNQLPPFLEAECAVPTPALIPHMSYVALAPENGPPRYAQLHHTPAGVTYHEVWLDKHRRPHLTGRLTAPIHNHRIDEDVLPVEIWNDEPTIPRMEYGSSVLNDLYNEMRAKPHSIIGPITTAYPRNVGWHPASVPRKAGTPPKPLKLSDLTIKLLTKIFTSEFMQRGFPNCAKAWRAHFPRGAIMSFKIIFKSFGTKLSDATEERQWRKFVHRATNVRNRNPKLPDHSCRLCRRTVESMLHLLECQLGRPFWRACLRFITTILKCPMPRDLKLAIAFGQWKPPSDPDPLGPEEARAFLRHAFNHFYHDFANVDLKSSAFTWQSTYLATLHSFREAARRRGQSFKILFASRLHTALPNTPPQEELHAFPTVLTCHVGGTFLINPAIDAEIESAKNILIQQYQSN